VHEIRREYFHHSRVIYVYADRSLVTAYCN
jgi:hypothetical protein